MGNLKRAGQENRGGVCGCRTGEGKRTRRCWPRTLATGQSPARV